MVSIRQCVTDALNRQGQGDYIQFAEPIISVLDERETHIKEALRRFAQERGLSRQQVDHAFAMVGLDESATPMTQQGTQQGFQGSQQGSQQGWTPPQAGQVNQTPGDWEQVQDAIRTLTRQVEALTTAAQRAGVQV